MLGLRTLGAALVAVCAAVAFDPVMAAEAVSREAVQAAVRQLDELAQSTLKSMQLPGIAVTVIHRDEVVFQQGYGVLVAGQPEAVTDDTVFQLASVSKPLTATILARLVGQKKIAWDDRVIDRDPAFRMYDAWVTRELRLRDLLCHRSGLPDHGGDLLEDLGYPRADVLQRLRELPPEYSFRAGYAYTNFGYSEAAYAAAKSLGMTWEELADKEFFQPLGMTSSSFRHADYAKHTNRARLHVKADGRWQQKFDRQPDGQAPAGGASANLKDLAIWLRLLLNNGQHDGQTFIEAAALAETHQPHSSLSLDLATGRFGSYGLGWNIGVERGQRVTWKHSGAFALGLRTEVALIPSENLAIAVLSHAAPTGVPEGLTESFFDWALDGKLERDWVALANQKFDEMAQEELAGKTDYSHPPQSPQPPLPLEQYAGTFDHEFYGPATVVVRDDHLELQLGPQRQAFPLQHWNRDVFTWLPAGENSPGRTGATFVPDAAGQAVSLQLENLRRPGLQDFQRATKVE